MALLHSTLSPCKQCEPNLLANRVIKLATSSDGILFETDWKEKQMHKQEKFLKKFSTQENVMIKSWKLLTIKFS